MVIKTHLKIVPFILLKILTAFWFFMSYYLSQINANLLCLDSSHLDFHMYLYCYESFFSLRNFLENLLFTLSNFENHFLFTKILYCAITCYYMIVNEHWILWSLLIDSYYHCRCRHCYLMSLEIHPLFCLCWCFCED